ncbi:MAG: hypothetical protein KME31_02095 [Tolypothrix carrinoi HA7290-LM1]|nr:hypothetical protein [Tolypothrix carrinoi HA7290-LM1]
MGIGNWELVIGKKVIGNRELRIVNCELGIGKKVIGEEVIVFFITHSPNGRARAGTRETLPFSLDSPLPITHYPFPIPYFPFRLIQIPLSPTALAP